MKNVKTAFGMVFVSLLLLIGQTKTACATKTPGDFNLSNRFSLEIDGVRIPGIESIKNIESSVEVIEYKDGEGGIIHSRPGQHKPGRMVITKDWSNTLEFYKWFQSTDAGKTDRKSISVIFQNDAGEESGRMNFYNCWPVRWTAPEINGSARSSGHANEKLEISWETMEMKSR